MQTSSGSRQRAAGFTLMEVIFVIVLLGLFATFATMKLVTPATMTLAAQAQSLATVIRRAQSLAVVRGERTRVSVTTSGVNGSLAVACPASTPCITDTSLTVSQGAVLGSTSATFYFNSLGQPVDSAGTPLTVDPVVTLGYQTGAVSATYSVTVAKLTGRISVSP
jgi:prepilin-type N-terminal cleavage/methylation domain-containing protein